MSAPRLVTQSRVGDPAPMTPEEIQIARVRELLAFHTPNAVRFTVDDVGALLREYDRILADNAFLRIEKARWIAGIIGEAL